MPGWHTLSLAVGCGVIVAGWPGTARADDRVLFLREDGAVEVPPAGGVVPAVEAGHGENPAEVEATATEALHRARALFLTSAFSEAAGALHRAHDLTAGDLPRVRVALAVTLELWTGACELLAGSTDGSRSAFRRALALDPDVRLPPGTFPPAVETFFTNVTAEAQRQGRGSTTVVSVPAGARVEVDGQSRGVTPVTVSLAAGEHVLRLEHVGYERYTDLLDVTGHGLRESPAVVLQRASGTVLRAQVGAPGGLLDLPDTVTLATLAQEFRVDRVVYARRDGTRVEYPGDAPRRAVVWPWLVGGAAVVAAAVGTVLYVALKPQAELRLHVGF